MGIKSKVAIAVLSLGVICAPTPAQGPAQDPPPAQQGPLTGPGGHGMMRPGPMGRGVGRRNRRSMRGRGLRRQGFGQAGLLNSPAIRERLGITSAQFAKMQQQASDFRKSQIRARADLQVKRIELNELLTADNPDRAAIDAKLQEVSASQMASEKSAIDNLFALRDILTPAQRQQLQEIRTNGFQPRGTPQTRPGASRRDRDPGQRSIPPPPDRQSQAPANQ